ncbi:MAG: LptF/LptG family permease, partial [Planctomycetes bacterium]|nr:LptF/LptG family permease [Planctomycetota bacterium]
PSLLVALVLGGLTYWVGAEVQPHSKRDQRQLIKKAAIMALENMQPGRTTLKWGEYYLSCKYRDPDEDGVFHFVNMLLPDSVSKEKTHVIADRVRVGIAGDRFQITAYGAKLALPGQSLKAAGDQTFFSVPLDKLVSTSNRSLDRPSHLTSSEIWEELRTTTPDEKRARLMNFELHYRPAMACIFLVFALLGVSTGLYMRNGNQLAALVVAIGYGLIYFVFSVQLGRDLGKGGEVPPWVGAWTVPIVGMAIALLALKPSLKR